MARTASRTTLYSQNIQGNPLIADLLTFPGDIYFVGSAVSGATDATTYGRTPDKPFATLAYAAGRVTANKGDAILVLPGHAEAVASAGAINITRAGTRVIGLGVGAKRPTFTYTTNTAKFYLSGANSSVENLIFNPISDVDVVAVPLQLQAANCVVRNCRFMLANATYQADIGISVNNINNSLIEDNVFLGTNNAGTTSAIHLSGSPSDGTVVRRNLMIGAYSSAIGGIQNGNLIALTNVLIDSNVINNLTAGSTKAMTFYSATTGMIVNNRMQILSGTAPITGAAMSWTGNYYAAVVATAGTLV